MHKINKDKIFNFIMSLRDSDSSFVLQKKFNQSTLMSSAFSLLTLELIGCIESLNPPSNTHTRDSLRSEVYKEVLSRVFWH